MILSQSAFTVIVVHPTLMLIKIDDNSNDDWYWYDAYSNPYDYDDTVNKIK